MGKFFQFIRIVLTLNHEEVLTDVGSVTTPNQAFAFVSPRKDKQ